LRYPDTHRLFVLARRAGGSHGHRHLEHTSAPGTARVRSGDPADARDRRVASERIDEDPHWLLLAHELLHVAAGRHLPA
jgi:glutamine amidotransferase